MANQNSTAKANGAQAPRDTAFFFNQQRADRLRQTLMSQGCYPTGDMIGDEGYDYYENNVRTNLLPATVARLDRNDLVALQRIAELLAGHPRGEGFAWYDWEGFIQ